MNKKQLFNKYSSNVPRYTSYPPIPYWSNMPTQGEWVNAINQDLADDNNSLSLYIHLPFCESLCTYCGCSTLITKNHDVESSYIDALLKEFAMYSLLVPKLGKSKITQFHLGGGTPTFMSVANLNNLLKPILERINISEASELAFEADPRVTTKEHMESLRLLGFNRISLGVQDLDIKVQESVNRIQSPELIESLVRLAKDLGYKSINYDLIYGLPNQTQSSIKQTMEHVVKNMPDRIALYSFAYVPWIKPAHRKWQDEDLPNGDEKYELYNTSRNLLLEAGYKEIGMDHFALEHDELYTAYKNNKLNRNFMGYTNQNPKVLLGLGMSAISTTSTIFHQNIKVVPSYEKEVINGNLATSRGHILSEADKMNMNSIRDILTRYEVVIPEDKIQAAEVFFSEMKKDNLVELVGNKLQVTNSGKPFIRNIAVFFDEYMNKNNSNVRFSKTI